MLRPHVGDTADYNHLPHSYFPCLDSRPGENRAWQSSEVPFNDAVRVRSFCKEYNVSSLVVFQTAWAMVLRCYLGSPAVCFASNSSEVPDDANSTTVSVCEVAFTKATSILDVLRGAYTKYFPSPFQPLQTQSSIHEQPESLDILPMNTSLIHREDNRSMMDRPAIPKSTLTGLENVWHAESFPLLLWARCHD